MRPVIFLSMLLLNSFIFLSQSYAHSGHVFDAAIDACRELNVGDKCEYIPGGDKRYRGTCQVLSGAKLCVRNQPIEILKRNYEKENSEPVEHQQGDSIETVATDLPSVLSNPLLTFF